MIKYKVEFDVAKYQKSLGAFRNQLPFATSKALNDTGWEVRKHIQNDMKRIFNNPTPYVISGIKYMKSDKRNLRGELYIEDFGGKGTSPEKILSPSIYGGDRGGKKSERLLRSKGILPPNMYWVPAKGVKLNRYGNISAGMIVQILSALKANTEMGFLANRTANSKKRNKNLAEFFYINKQTGKMPAGIYQRDKNGKIKMILYFITKPIYKRIFQFHELAIAHANRIFPIKMEKAIEFAIRTAK